MRSGKFRMKRLHCYTVMLLHQASWVAWMLLIIMAGLAVAGFICSPWIGIAALGVDAFIAVMAVSFVIMVYGFYSITGVNMTEHHIASSGDKIKIEFEEGDPVELEKGALQPYHIYPGGVVLPVRGNKSGWLWLSPKAFETDEDFQNFLKELYESNTKQE